MLIIFTPESCMFLPGQTATGQFSKAPGVVTAPPGSDMTCFYVHNKTLSNRKDEMAQALAYSASI